MEKSKPTGLSRFGGAALAVAIAGLVACTAATQPEKTGESQAAVWTNGGFTAGAPGLAPGAPWAVATNTNNGILVQTPQTLAGLQLQPGGLDTTGVLAGTNVVDPDLGAGASLRFCRYANRCAIVNQHGNNQNVNSLSQSMTVAAGDVDPADGLVHVRFTIAPVLQNPAHTAVDQPYYFVRVTDDTKGTILYSDFNLSGAGIAWKKINAGAATEIDYTDWQLVDVVPGSAGVALGDAVTLLIMGSGCQPGAHWGEVYVDGLGTTNPGLNVEGTGPAQANAGSAITYTLTYKNGGASAATGVTIDFTTPPGTTFQSITPPAGATCVTPAVGMAGTIVCTFSSAIAAAASGSFTVTVLIAAGTTGTLTESNYQIQSTQETTLIGPPITTQLGCTKDAQCTGGRWCDEATSTCTAQLPNGTAVPNDPPHTNPTLNGTCTAGAGTLVCVSAVCDAKDNKCGYANGDGPCTAGNGATVCRSGFCAAGGLCEPIGGCSTDADCTAGNWCDENVHTCTPKLANGVAVPSDPPHTNPTLNGTCTVTAGALVCVSGVCDTKDNDCGYANGDGPCTAGNGATVCRSGTCSPSGVCEVPGACATDADCTGGNWCDETTATCTAKLANGSSIPVDGPHKNPTLDGQCLPTAATLVCVSGVCDINDNRCGYANGDGPCTAGNGGTVCRSGACSVNGTCEPAGGCNANGDCTNPAMPDCNTTTHSCQPGPDGGSPVDSGTPVDSGKPVDSGSAGDAAVAKDASGGADAAAGADASPTSDAGSPPEVDASEAGFLEGGGVSCGVSPARGGDFSLAGTVAALAMLGVARRRRRHPMP